jgi:hypothetical protein
MADDVLERLGLALPPFLSAEGKRELLAQLRRYPENSDYYGLVPDEHEPVQGDAWRGLLLFDFESGERHDVQGLIVSNSCDIAAANNPDPNQRVAFAPVLDLARYRDFLIEAGKRPNEADDYLAQVRRQEIYRLFYLPAMHGHFGESIVPLDELHSIPLRALARRRLDRVFTLSMYGWYVLLVKLSIHFTRMGENVDRRPYVPGPDTT